MKTKRTSPILPRKQAVMILLVALMGAALISALMGWNTQRNGSDSDTVVVYKRATCECCAKWIAHLEQSGFKVEAHNEHDLVTRQTKLGSPDQLRTCHTALVGGYLIEGHVPAEDIRRLLSEKPKARGLAVPGLPIGSPGMEQGRRRDQYATLMFQSDGDATVFAQHGTAP